MQRQTLDKIIQARAARKSIVTATLLETGETRIIDPSIVSTDALTIEAAKAAAADKSTKVEVDGKAWFLNVHNAPLKLLIIGAVHIAQPLSHLAAISGFDVTIIDPRTAFATELRFPGARIITSWPDEALNSITLDRRTAVVALTHDPKLDDPALLAALNAPCFYIGALGSKKTHSARRERLQAKGIPEQALSRIHGPVGLDIGAVSPAEIAVSIIAQAIAVLRTGTNS